MSDYEHDFQPGDRVYAHSPANDSWSPDYVATVADVFPSLGRMHIRWDHGPVNYSVEMADYLAVGA